MNYDPPVISRINVTTRIRPDSNLTQRAFTLVELLVVISIIAVLAAILLSVTQKSKEAANAAKCVSKLRAVGTAISLYCNEKGAYPKAGHSQAQFTGQSWWFEDVLPYLGQAVEPPVDDQKDRALRCSTVKTPRPWPYIDYGINGYVLPNGEFDIPRMKVENPSTTFLVADAINWIVAPPGWPGNGKLAQQFVFRHGNAANVVMFDGHVEKITKQQVSDPKAEKRMKGLP